MFRWKFIARLVGVLALALILPAPAQAAARYYLSSEKGNDANSGLRPESAWKSLDKVNATEFQPGDRLFIESGSVFQGQLSLQGGGVKSDGKLDFVVVDCYGEGPRPRIDGEGKVVAAVLLHNVQGWRIRNLEITNTGPTRERNRHGILVRNDRLPVLSHIALEKLLIRDVNGSYPKRRDAGSAIFFSAVQPKKDGGVHTRFDNILIDGCHIRNCSRNGIIIHGGPLRDAWNPSTRVVVRRNLIEGVGGDGIVPSCCDGALIEWNTMRDCPAYGKEGEAAAGIWPWSCDNTILQFNEVSGHKAWVDGQAFDCDYNCNNTVYQYNYSHGNEGGFMLICSPGIKKHGWLAENSWNKGSVVRYNLSIDDGSRTTGGIPEFSSPTFLITGEATQNTRIYRNLVIVPKKADPRMDSALLEFGKWGGKYPLKTVLMENVFAVESGQKGTFEFGGARKVLLEANHFYGDVDGIEETREVASRDNRFLDRIPKTVTIRGPEQERNQFREFLKAKGNPHEARGIVVEWKSEG